jgi:transcriptional regulator with GAF, ATPase, and Fis domain
MTGSGKRSFSLLSPALCNIFKSGFTDQTAVAALEYEMVVAELKANDGNMAAAARNLGLTERQIGLRVKRFSIDFKRFRRGDVPTAPKVTSA